MNISQIAHLAEVSVSAVSRYLNNGYVSEEKRQRIAKVIEETGYRPMKFAQTLRTGKTNLIGVIVPKISSGSISRMINGISSVLEGTNYKFLLANTYNDPEKEIEYLEFFKDKTVDGVILIGTIITKRHTEIISQYKKPFVLLAQKMTGTSCVYFDDHKAAYLAAQCLADRGCSKIACLGVTVKDRAAGVSRYEGFEAALRENGIIIDKKIRVESGFTYEEAYKAATELINKNYRFDGVFCATDTIAIALIKALNDNGIKVPDDVKVVGIGDSIVSSYYTPSVTTVHLFYRTAGEEACKMLIEILENDDKKIVKNNLIGCELIERESTCSEKWKIWN